jgi:diguanylate cyclase (GGDEF)-like protein
VLVVSVVALLIALSAAVAVARLSRHDRLTGLGNHSRFRQVSQRAISRGARTGRHMAILVIDMNGFQEIDDTLGHKSGERVLAEFAEVLRRCVPASGLPARLGGDEFAVVLPEIKNPEEAYEVAGRIAASLGPVAVDGRLITLAAGIGVAVAAPGELTHDEIVHRADLAMYKAKSLGPQTRWAIWQESLEPFPAAGELPAAA